MLQTYNHKEKLRQFLIILLPILVTQVGMFSMNFFDTTMSGHYNAKDLAGVAIGSSLWVPISTGLTGILLAIMPIIAQLVGAKKNNDVGFSVIQGAYVAIMLAILVMIVGAFAINPVLDMMNLEIRVKTIAHDYLLAISTGIIPLFVYYVFRSFIDSLGKTRISMFITISSLPVNILFNYLFIYGKFGFPELGGVGTGYATSITYWVLLFVSMVIIHKQMPFSQYKVFHTLHALSFHKIKEILQIGIPIGLSIFFETSIFSAVTLLMSRFDTITIAAHQVALNFASLLYMIPLSISMALTIIVGFEVGAKRFQDARAYSFMGVSLALIMAIFSGLAILLFREEVAGIYTTNPEAIQLAKHFLIFAIFFQISDAIQAPIQGALRGYKDVNITFIMSLISYWGIGLPFGYILALYTDWGPFGYWIGLITGLAAGAITLSYRLISIQRRKFSLNE